METATKKPTITITSQLKPTSQSWELVYTKAKLSEIDPRPNRFGHNKIITLNVSLSDFCYQLNISLCTTNRT